MPAVCKSRDLAVPEDFQALPRESRSEEANGGEREDEVPDRPTPDH
jgi:hypothetical protein